MRFQLFIISPNPEEMQQVADILDINISRGTVGIAVPSDITKASYGWGDHFKDVLSTLRNIYSTVPRITARQWLEQHRGGV